MCLFECSSTSSGQRSDTIILHRELVVGPRLARWLLIHDDARLLWCMSPMQDKYYSYEYKDQESKSKKSSGRSKKTSLTDTEVSEEETGGCCNWF
eukprot:5750822-Pyramimonas_sp.AAC.1